MTHDPTAMRGIVPSLNTPFAANGDLDLNALPRLVGHVVDAGCRGALILAAAGENAYLTPSEWQSAAIALADAACGVLPLIISATSEHLDESVRRARHSGQIGACCVLWQPPPGATLAAIGDGIARLGEAAGRPVMLQDLDFEGDGLPVSWILALLEQQPAFASLKIEIQDAGPKYSAVLDATGGALHVAGGWAVRTMTDALARGVDVFIPTGMERLYVAIDKLWRSGEHEAAERLFARLRPILDFSNRDLDHSIRFFKRMRACDGLFGSDRVRVSPRRMSVKDMAEADRLIALAEALDRALPRG